MSVLLHTCERWIGLTEDDVNTPDISIQLLKENLRGHKPRRPKKESRTRQWNAADEMAHQTNGLGQEKKNNVKTYKRSNTK